MVPPHDQSFVNVRCSPAAWPPSEVVNLEAFHPDTYLVLTRYQPRYVSIIGIPDLV